MTGTSVDFIGNDSEKNLRDVLNNEIPQASTVAMSVAFLTDYGLTSILDSLMRVIIAKKISEPFGRSHIFF